MNKKVAVCCSFLFLMLVVYIISIDDWNGVTGIAVNERQGTGNIVPKVSESKNGLNAGMVHSFSKKKSDLPSGFKKDVYENVIDDSRLSEYREKALDITDFSSKFYSGDLSEDWLGISLIENHMLGYEASRKCYESYPYQGECGWETSIVIENNDEGDGGVINYVEAKVLARDDEKCSNFVECFTASAWDNVDYLPSVNSKYVSVQLKRYRQGLRIEDEYSRSDLERILEQQEDELKECKKNIEYVTNEGDVGSEGVRALLRMCALKEYTVELSRRRVEDYE